jgi:hypothetical protein
MTDLDSTATPVDRLVMLPGCHVEIVGWHDQMTSRIRVTMSLMKSAGLKKAATELIRWSGVEYVDELTEDVICKFGRFQQGVRQQVRQWRDSVVGAT